MPKKILIYSDGACSGNPGPGGWGCLVIFEKEKQVIELSGYDPKTTNNRMELQAAIEALKYVASTSQDISLEINIYTDSVYVIRGITQWIFGWKKRSWKNNENEEISNQDLWQELDRVVTRLKNKLNWKYVKGHAGVPGNERCDQLAVAESKRAPLEKYRGSTSHYLFDVSVYPPERPLPESSWAKSTGEKKKVAYLSLVNGVLKKHDTWSACEAEVKGRPGAKFKKFTTDEEEIAIKKNWGLS